MNPPMPPRRLRLRLIAGLVLPIIAFVVLLEVFGNATGALAVTDGIPVVWVLAFAVWRRRIEPITLIPVAVFTLALVLTIAFGGSALPLELRRSWFPATVGLACLISLAVRRPLLVIAAEKLAAAHPERMPQGGLGLDPVERRRLLSTLTAIVGITGTADAAAQIALALTVSTATFGVVARIASYVIVASGLAVGAIYVQWVRGRARRGCPRPEP
jgi:hypothetical protein